MKSGFSVYLFVSALLTTAVGPLFADGETAVPAKDTPKLVETTTAPGDMLQSDPTEQQYETTDIEPRVEDKAAKWLTWGFDMRLRETYQKNPTVFNNHAPNNERNFQRYRFRLFSTVRPIKEIEINSRLMWEFRHWCKPDSMDSNPPSEALFDILNFKIIKPFGTGLTATIGRQDIMIGDGWLVADGTPLDGTRTMFFDAMRFQYDLDENNNLDFIYVEQGAKGDKYIKPFNYQPDQYLAEENSTGILMYWNNKNLIPRSELSAYFIYKADRKVLPKGNNDDIYTAGARLAGFLDKAKKKVYYRAEIAQQLGHIDYADMCALGFNSLLEYRFGDKWNSSVNLAYEFLSGDDPNTKTNEQFNPLWGRWPQWSDLMTYAYTNETAFSEITNLQRVGLGWNTSPCKNISFDGAYQLLFAVENTRRGDPLFSNNGKFRGQLVQARMKYQFTEYISGHLQGEVLFPGDYYASDNRDPVVMLRYQLVFSF